MKAGLKGLIQPHKLSKRKAALIISTLEKIKSSKPEKRNLHYKLLKENRFQLISLMPLDFFVKFS